MVMNAVIITALKDATVTNNVVRTYLLLGFFTKRIYYPVAFRPSMDVFEAIRKRRTVRKYTDEPVHKHDLERMLEAARLAPSGMNAQPWELVVVLNKQTKFLLTEACSGQEFVGEAAAVICGLDDPSAKWARVDLALAMEHIVLEATELGYGCCFVGAFSKSKVRHVLCIPEDKDVVVLLAIGWPAEKPGPSKKKPLSNLVHWGAYGQKKSPFTPG